MNTQDDLGLNDDDLRRVEWAYGMGTGRAVADLVYALDGLHPNPLLTVAAFCPASSSRGIPQSP